MKTLVISDLHGHDSWKSLCKNEHEYDKIIFLGDYTDSFTIPGKDIIDNLIEIIEFKQKNHEKVELLLGNHDTQYISKFRWHRVSGFRQSYEKQMNDIFDKNLTLFKIAFSYDKFLFTHAGINDSWAKRNCLFSNLTNSFETQDSVSCDELCYNINELFFNSNESIFDCGSIRRGRQATGGPLWNDIREIKKSKILENIIQIAGHTPKKEVHIIQKNKHSKMIFCDCLPYEYITIINGKVIVNKY